LRDILAVNDVLILNQKKKPIKTRIDGY